MGQRTGFAVPKDRQDVTVHLNSGTALDGAIFLEYAPGDFSVHHKVVAFLEDDNLFFPLLRKESGTTEFIHKTNVRFIELDYEADRERVDAAVSLMQHVGITAFFLDGTSVSGALLAEVPVEKARLSDCLNLPTRFLIVKIDNRIRYLNKESLVKVVYTAP